MLDRCRWHKLDAEFIETFLAQANPLLGDQTAAPASSEVIFAALPFYQNFILMELSDTAWTTGPRWFLGFQDHLFPLDGASAPIHDVNEKDNLALTADTVEDYMRFFCFFVHGDEGPFFIVDDGNHPALDREKMDGETKKNLAVQIQPVRMEPSEHEGTFELSATVLYGTTLFLARFAVTQNGMIEMIDDNPVMGDLPVRKIKPNY